MKILTKIPTDMGFVIIPVHYTHDPEKDEEWIAGEQAKYRRESMDWQRVWDREMELDFTTVAGAPAYPNFADVNVIKTGSLDPNIPLCLCVDFNVEPMVWEIAQIIQGDAFFLDEICQAPSSVPAMVEEFRNRYSAHLGEVWVYGDATGKARSPQSGRSYYDIMMLHFRGYHAPMIYKVPVINPGIRDRVNAFNLRLKDEEGTPHIFIHKDRCPELLKDMVEVVMKEDGSKIVKVSKREDAYFWRTHASDSAGYFVWREWPTMAEVARRQPPRPKRRTPRRLLGDLR